MVGQWGGGVGGGGIVGRWGGCVLVGACPTTSVHPPNVTPLPHPPPPTPHPLPLFPLLSKEGWGSVLTPGSGTFISVAHHRPSLMRLLAGLDLDPAAIASARERAGGAFGTRVEDRALGSLVVPVLHDGVTTPLEGPGGGS